MQPATVHYSHWPVPPIESGCQDAFHSWGVVLTPIYELATLRRGFRGVRTLQGVFCKRVRHDRFGRHLTFGLILDSMDVVGGPHGPGGTTRQGS